MSLLTWSIAILIGLMFLAGLTYILWAIVAKIRLTKTEERERIDIFKDHNESGEINPDEHRDRMRDDE
jgi:hypothetical protein